MKILLSAYSCAPDSGSEPGCGWNWAIELAKEGNTVYCLTASNNKSKIEKKMLSLKIRNLHFIYIFLPRWVESTKTLNIFPLSYFHYILWQLYAYRMAVQMHKNIVFDIVHHVTFGSLQLGSFMWKLPIPFVFGPVGGGEKIPAELKKFSTVGFFRESLRKLTSFFIMNVLRNTKAASEASLLLTTSCDTADLAKSLGAENVKLFLDCGISEDFMPKAYSKNKESQEIQVLWVGKFLPQKGLSLVLEVFNNLKEYENIKLTIVGDGPMRPDYENFVRTNNLSEKVSFVGMISYGALKNYYLNYDILIFCPLRNAFGIQLLEAMACGLPVITLDQHGAGTLIPEGVCIKVNPKEDNLILKLKENIVNLAVDKKYRQLLSLRGRNFAEKNTWRKKVEFISNEYEMLLLNKNIRKKHVTSH
ncbi:glycosyltransferase [Porifericola rhodea]|uniref:glycosyltransferase n=1 Tax=Porifericola rhodea TaxID=930972 RepID=UPI002666F479|nr:glycosyltransferase [Porifericola rhodea]WKN32526.1 glycosyltransferase [Porifericola rhodea]